MHLLLVCQTLGTHHQIAHHKQTVKYYLLITNILLLNKYTCKCECCFAHYYSAKNNPSYVSIKKKWLKHLHSCLFWQLILQYDRFAWNQSFIYPTMPLFRAAQLQSCCKHKFYKRNLAIHNISYRT